MYFVSNFHKMAFMEQEYFPKSYDNFKVFLYKKIERISLALYLCTDHISDDVSLKTNIRIKADSLIKDILQFNRGDSNHVATNRLRENFMEIKSLLFIGLNCSLINQNNVQVLSEEMNRLNREIENQKDSFVGDSEFKKSFFVVESRSRLPENKDVHPEIDKGHKGQEVASQTINETQEKSDINKRQTEPQDTTNRTEEIMKIIKDNKRVTIKDISSQIKNCSEKTIQRELIKMVSLNLIKKEGERRWSTYSIA